MTGAFLYTKSIKDLREIKKAGDGNRTHVSSLEGWCSTIEPRLQIKLSSAQNRNRTSDTRIFSPLLYQLSYLGFQGTRKEHYTHSLALLQHFFTYSTLLIADMILSALIGLLICPFIPAFIAVCISSGSASAVIAIIGIVLA